MILNESTLEQATLEWLLQNGWAALSGPTLAPDGEAPERQSYADLVLTGRLRRALGRINPGLPADALDEAIKKAAYPEGAGIVGPNRAFHKMLTDGVDVEFSTEEGPKHDKVWLLDFEHPENNDLLAVNQFTIKEKDTRRPDLLLFVNGLPLVVMELKDFGNENATLDGAYNQLQTYQEKIPSLFAFNALSIISDGHGARFGSITADFNRYMRWRSIDGEQVAPKGQGELEVMIQGMLTPGRLLDLIRYFTVFEDDDDQVVKKIAGYHQYFAVNKAVETTVQSSAEGGSKKAGVIWHTQGSGKSLSMLFYAGKIIARPEMKNPTLVVLTDRNDLDDQLFGTFSMGQALLRQKPKQAESRADLHDLLAVESGGVVFTTIQKFFPESGESFPVLSARHNIIFIADEAHRSQYGFKAKLALKDQEAQLKYGFAKHMRDALPNAAFIGFTGTPVSKTEHNTQNVFGDYIDVYDISRAVDDGATVKIYYANRMAKLALAEEEKPKLDPGFEELTELEEATTKDKLKTKWGNLEALVGTPHRLELIAKDLVEHFEARDRAMPFEGKAMIVCMSRRICVDLYEQIVKLRPDWHGEGDEQGKIKVVMTGSAADPQGWQPHIRPKKGRKQIERRFKDVNDSLKLVLVRDMWLTGFDVPCLHTMYVDKPMKEHGLMQAIARVNRVFKDKGGGLVVDYLGIGDNLKQALSDYTKADQDETGTPQEQAVGILQEKLGVLRDMFHSFDYSKVFDGSPSERYQTLSAALEFILGMEGEGNQEEAKKRFLQAVSELYAAFTLAIPHEDALAVQEEVAFFQALRGALVKSSNRKKRKSKEELEAGIKQLVSQAVTGEGIIDIFEAAGLNQPDISILDDRFLEEVKNLKHKNLALEALKRLLNNEIKAKTRTNLVKQRSFLKMLEDTLTRYQNRGIQTAEVIQELIDLAKKFQEAMQRGESLGLNTDEEAFYDALSENGSAREVMGDEQLKAIALELVKQVKASVTIDWQERESARAKIRVLVRRILKKYGYPPDLSESATQTVLKQTETLCEGWV